MDMKKRLLLWCAGLACLAACRQPEEVSPQPDVIPLYNRFHGKYSLVHATSSEAVDVNLDGKASTDLLDELTDLRQTNIEVRIYGKTPFNPEPSFLFAHQWPKQEFFPEKPAGYVPGLQPRYATKVVVRSFAFDPSLTELVLETPASMLADPDLYTPLQSVTVQTGDRIEVTFTKRLYTSAGWKTVRVTSLYARYTMTT